jgi:hypothetical protein
MSLEYGILKNMYFMHFWGIILLPHYDNLNLTLKFWDYHEQLP